jgi:hypothetical protein
MFFLPLCALMFPQAPLHAQESAQVYIAGRRYLNLNIHSLDKYAARFERTQRQLLHRLARRERCLARRLGRTDSAAYARYLANPLTYDSIVRLARTRPDSATLAARARRTGEKAVDTLKGVYAFLQTKAAGLNNIAGTATGAAGLGSYAGQISGLTEQLSYSQYIDQLINQRTASLESIAGSNSLVTGMQKELYYAKSKIAEWKKIAEEPTKAEELALEYLQGTKGFTLDGAGGTAMGAGPVSGVGAGGKVSADDLERMGYQTKRQVAAGLQQKYGSNLGAMQGNLSKEVDKWQSEAQGLAANIKETKQALTGLRNTEKPKFRINPMRGLPFRKRIEHQYGFQTTRATAAGKPAMVQLSSMAGYRLSPRLSAGIGAALNTGLGQSWSAIRFTFEGLGMRSYVAWQWQYGIGVYGGYERTWKEAAFGGSAAEAHPPGPGKMCHEGRDYSEALLLGVTKSYRINTKWNGAVQLLYDAWWQDKGLKSPLVLRFTTQTK